MTERPNVSSSINVALRVTEFEAPCVQDCLVIGRKASIGCEAFAKCLQLLQPSPFVCLHPDDEIITDIVIRSAILRRISEDKIIDLILKHVKPLMGEEEILHVDVNVEVLLEQQA